MSESLSEKLVLVVKENRFLGWLLLPYLVERHNKNFLTATQAFTTCYEEELADNRLIELHRTANLLDPQGLANRFSKKKLTAAVFFDQADKKVMNEMVMPFVWKQLERLLQLGLDLKLPLYQSNGWPSLYPNELLSYNEIAAEVALYFTRTDEKTIYRLEVLLNNKAVQLSSDSIILSYQPCLLLHQNKILHFASNINGKLIQPFLNKQQIDIPRRTEKQYYESFIKKSASHTHIHAEGFELIDLEVHPKALLCPEQNWQGDFGLSLSFVYNDKTVYPHQKQQRFTTLHSSGDGFTFKRFTRDRAIEKACINQLLQLGFEQQNSFFTWAGTAGQIAAEDQQIALIERLQEIGTKLNEAGMQIVQQAGQAFLLASPELQTESHEKQDWFDLRMTVKAGSHTFPFMALKNHILNGERVFRLNDGQHFLIPEAWFSRYKGLLIHAQADKLEQHFMLKKQHTSLLRPDQELVSMQDLSETAEVVPVPLLENASLRSYQKTGFLWLNWLAKHSFGGILADDMGLGKTVQIISLLLHWYPSGSIGPATGLKAAEHQLDLFGANQPDDLPQTILTTKPSLIIMPASLIHNWIDELKRFAPRLRFINYTGSVRSMNKNKLKQHPVVLTTYGTLRNDVDLLKDIDFKFVILDESQAIKNHASKTAQAAFSLSKETAIAMTGTPIENSLNDLWSQMEFANPGLLGSLQQFEQFYAGPIRKVQDKAASEALQKLLKPFVLRRTKSAVAKELPPLTQIISYCEMLPEQRELYEQEKSRLRNLMLQATQDGQARQTLPVLVLRALMRLRQLANHPAMAFEKSDIGSGKFEMVTEKLQTLLAENHKVLLFSAFTSHLKQYVRWLDEQKLTYSLLTGSTRKREEVVHAFKENDQVQVFLISLKAGGFGLNLTEAGYVFLLDPWWNPAAELQALNRAHRIGQDKKVFVYRFISSETVEEKIQTLQSYKTALADQVLDAGFSHKPELEALMRLLD